MTTQNQATQSQSQNGAIMTTSTITSTPVSINGGRMTTQNQSTGTPHLNVATLKGMSVTEFFGVRRGMTLTTCCACNRDLEDSQSVSEGIGPVCSAKYGYKHYVPSQQSIAACLGHLALLPIATDMEVMGYLLANQNDERKFANILVAYCSHLSSVGKDAEVFDYTPAIAALGLGFLAEQLRISRCPIKVVPNTMLAQGASKPTRIGTPIAGEFVVTWSQEMGRISMSHLQRKYGLQYRTSNMQGVGRTQRYVVDQQGLELVLWELASKQQGVRTYNCGSIADMPAQSTLPVPALVQAYRTANAPAMPTPASIGLKITKRTGKFGVFYTVSLPPFWNLGYWKPNKADQKAFWTAFKDDFKRSAKAGWSAQYKHWTVRGSNKQAMLDAISRHLGYTATQLGV